ncbi:MAG: metallophosphatase domain-containing protein [Candidatus Thorarchaeota archaeon]|jgi:predicted phosphodiesterase
MRVICISDTHARHKDITIPDGDLLIHAGDFSMMGYDREVSEFKDWFSGLPHKHKIAICGNHEVGLEGLSASEIRSRLALDDKIGSDYLHGYSTKIQISYNRSILLWGGPWQPEFMDWAYNVPRGRLGQYWERIPRDVEILVTHGGPYEILDKVKYPNPDGRHHVGCEELLKRVEELKLRSLKLHVFGHVHEAYGKVEEHGVTFVNASICDLHYRPVNPPIVVDI